MIYKKRTYKHVMDDKIWEIYQEVEAEAEYLYPQYFETCRPELYHNSSCRSLGRCVQSFQNPKERNVNKIRTNKCFILLSEHLGTDYDEIRSVLCHEFGHFVAPRENHGYLWKVRADKIGERWGIKASRLSGNEDFITTTREILKEKRNHTQYKYRLYCPECGAQWRYKTNCQAVQKPERYQCAKCKTKLKSEKIKEM